MDHPTYTKKERDLIQRYVKACEEKNVLTDTIAFYNSTQSHLSHDRQRRLSHMEMLSPTNRSPVGRIEAYSFDRTIANRMLQENQQQLSSRIWTKLARDLEIKTTKGAIAGNGGQVRHMVSEFNQTETSFTCCYLHKSHDKKFLNCITTLAVRCPSNGEQVVTLQCVHCVWTFHSSIFYDDTILT